MGSCYGLKNDKATFWSPFSECSKQEVEPSLRNNGVLNRAPGARIGVQLTPQGEEETAWLGESSLAFHLLPGIAKYVEGC